ncbi:hypothetical protein BCON_0188g00170 [Botryotinia convoluta]|uniref:Uncharacterized protein n=1 Tax=Botryotinia convoluta TaxID=54673 RepID=A0A4Z1HN65_9HELO|nr:hypothetical protein BCON_0188g00170 [Botryotinia convoluta]
MHFSSFPNSSSFGRNSETIRYHLIPIQYNTSKATPEPAWKAAYYHDIIVPDELKLLVSEASEHVTIVEKTGIITGERKAVIENGKSKVEINKDVMDVWEEYKRKVEEGEL